MKIPQRVHLKLAGILAVLALFVANASNGTACVFWFYQPKIPERLKEKLKS
jgi:cyclic lactone autoinducer peptide